jgi:flagellar basal-body rod protein FlgB
MIDAIDLFRLTGARMRYLTERQTVIARNIANADTPGYRAQDAAPFSFDSALLRGGAAASAGVAAPLALASTQPGHFGAQPALPSGSTPGTSTNSYGEKPDGNTVSIEEQMMKSADVANAFALASTAYGKAITLMKIAIGTSK